jgi:putative ABC transport system permease protein
MLALRTAFRQLGQDLRSQKLRSALTLLGITWGTLALGLLLSFGRGLHDKVGKDLSRAGENVVFAWSWRAQKSWEGLKKGRMITIREEDVEALRAQAVNLGALSPQYEWDMRAQVGDKARDVDVIAVSDEYFQIRKLKPLEGGRVLNAQDMAQRRRVAFLGDEVAQQLFGTGDPTGRELRLGGALFAIVGTLDKEDRPPGQRGWDAESAFIPLPTFKAMTGQETFHLLVFAPKDPERNGETTASVRQILSRRLRFDPTDKGALEMDDFTEFVRTMNAFMMALSILLGSAGLMTLVAGGVGVSNIMSITVEERTHEIGVKMALGAKSRLILLSFLIETLLLTALGGALGFLATFGILWVFPRFGLGQYVGTPSLSPLLVVVVIAVLGMIGLGAGFAPARRASTLDPVVAMKM